MEKRFLSTLSSESAADNVTACCLSFVRVSRIPLLVTELLNHIRKRQEYVFYGLSTSEWERHFRWLDRHRFGHINSEEKKKDLHLKNLFVEYVHLQAPVVKRSLTLIVFL